MYYERAPELREIVQIILKKHNKTEDDILYVRLHKKNTESDYVNVDYKEFIETNGNVGINTSWNGGKILCYEEFGMRIVLNSGEYLRVWEYDSSTGLEYIDKMPIDNVEIVKYDPFESEW